MLQTSPELNEALNFLLLKEAEQMIQAGLGSKS